MYIFRIEMSVGDVGDEFYFKDLPGANHVVTAVERNSKLASGEFGYLYEALREMSSRFSWPIDWGDGVSAVGHNVSTDNITKYIRITRCYVFEVIQFPTIA